MRLENVAPDKSVGTVLVHNVVGPDGHAAFSKGRLLRPEDLQKLQQLGLESVYVAVLEPGDVREDEAAVRLANLVADESIDKSKPSGGRVNFYAREKAFLQVDFESLRSVNSLQGITLATIPAYASLTPKKMIATLKTIGLALPATSIQQVESIVRASGPVICTIPIKNSRAAIILTGSENGRTRTQDTFAPPIRARVEEAGGQVISEEYVAEKEDAIGAAIQRALGAGAQLVILAGETSIMDPDDITPRGIRRAGGDIELYGAPVEPGNLLLLAYCGQVPIIGAPGCVKSRARNVVDMILPPLFVGRHLTRADVIAFANGGLLVG